MSARTRHAFRAEPPLYTPADRLEQLHRVAEAARELARASARRGVDGDEWNPLDLALDRLDEIDRYLGVP